MLYNNLSSYLRERYGGRLKKICIDGGFTCPNRDGTCGVGGCVFCGERGAGEHIADPLRSISRQVADGLAAVRDGEGCIAYFQNFTNTYAPTPVLKTRYDEALTDSRIRVLDVGTRPDCVTEENAELLASYLWDREVWVELGLQTANEETARRINRGYGNAAFHRAVSLLRERGIPVVVHIIVGLPGETLEDVENTVAYLDRYSLWGIKIHSLYVMRGTALEELYRRGSYVPLTLEEYAEAAAHVLSRISPDLIVHRITGDCPPELLAAPEWNRDKNRVIREINRILEERGWRQGCRYSIGEAYGKDQRV